MSTIALLRAEVLEANLELVRHGLVVHAFGNVSAIDRDSGRVVIKPSGVGYEELSPQNMVPVSLEGRVLESGLNPSSDTKTHLALYRAFPHIGAVVHTHSPYATAWAQAGKAIPCLGTTHADYFHGPVPVTRRLREKETETDYEYNTGLVIAEAIGERDPLTMPAVLVNSHGPFTWGRSVAAALQNAVILEEVARIAFMSLSIAPANEIEKHLLDRHYTRKHGANARYGQNK